MDISHKAAGKLIAEEVFNVAEAKREISWPPGLLGELAKSVFDYSIYPNREVSIMAALGVCAAVMGRRFNVSGSGLNLYLTLLMGTGSGKDVINDYINRFFDDANIFTGSSVFVGPRNFTGPKALMDTLYENKCFISILNEAGFLFKSQSGDGAGLTRTMLSLYGQSGAFGKLNPERYSNHKDNIPSVRSPCYSMLNESTSRVFMEAMRGEQGTETGELTRMTILNCTNFPHEGSRKRKYKISGELKRVFSAVMSFANATQTSDESKPVNIEITDEYWDYIDACKLEAKNCEDTDPVRSRMLSRQGFKTVKIASITAVLGYLEMTGAGSEQLNAMQDNGGVIPSCHDGWEWAKEFSKFELDGLGLLFGQHAADPKQAALNDLFNISLKLLEFKGFGKYKGEAQVSADLIHKMTVPRASLIRCLAGRRSIKAFTNFNKTEFDALMDYAVARGYYVIVKTLRGTGYKVTQLLINERGL